MPGSKKESEPEKTVKEMAEKMEKEIDAKKVLNLKYLDQNFHMQREILLEKKKREEKRGSK